MNSLWHLVPSLSLLGLTCHPVCSNFFYGIQNYLCIFLTGMCVFLFLIKECFVLSPYFDQFADCLVFFNQNTAVKHRMQKKCESDVADMRRRV